MSKMITIVDYGIGNIGSIENMLLNIGYQSKIVSNPDELVDAKKIIFPGVGKFDYGVKRLKESGLASVLADKVLVEKVPILGICVGMQLLFDSSEEGQEPGLGWISGEVKKFKFENRSLKVPHIGWNTVDIKKKDSPIVSHLIDEEEPRFYFVHSYYIDCDEEYRLMQTQYGGEFVSAVQKENIFACQFHPEKSHRFGKELFKSFGEIPC